MPDPALAVLRRHLVVRSALDAVPVARSAGRVIPSGANLVVFLDPSGRYVDHRGVVDGDDRLEDIVEWSCALADPAATAAFLISNRVGEEPADRPGDEARWCDLVEIAGEEGIDLLDWLVVWGRVLFSVAEHAAVPAGWPSTRDAVTEHPELRFDPARPKPVHEGRITHGRRRRRRPPDRPR
jgi:hypothetical protein